MKSDMKMKLAPAHTKSACLCVRKSTLLLSALIAVAQLFLSPPAVADEAAAVKPFEKFTLTDRFDRVQIIPQSARALLASSPEGRFEILDFNSGSSEPLVTLGSALEHTALSDDGKYVYALETGSDGDTRVWRISIDGMSEHRSVLLRELSGVPRQLTLTRDGMLIVSVDVDDAQSHLVLLNITQFESSANRWASFPGKEDTEVIDLPFAISDFAAVPEIGRIFVSTAKTAQIYGLPYGGSRQSSVPDLLTFVPLSGDALWPLKFTFGKQVGVEKSDGDVMVAAIADAMGRRLMVFEWNARFRTLDYVTKADIFGSDIARWHDNEPATAPILVHIDEDLSVIASASPFRREVYFFSYSNSVLELRDRRNFGPVLAMDVSHDGQFAALLESDGKVLRLVRPEVLAATSTIGSKPEVLQAQKQLISRNLLMGAADGIVGPDTQRAIKEFQQASGLAVSGVLDEKTLALLNQSPHHAESPQAEAFRKRFIEQGYKRELVDAFLAKGSDDACAERDQFPPERYWCNALDVARVVTEYERRTGATVTIASAYHSSAYSECTGEAPTPGADELRAIEFEADSGTPGDWISTLEKMASDGVFNGAFEQVGESVRFELRPSGELWINAGRIDKDGRFASPFYSQDTPPQLGDELTSKQALKIWAATPKLKGETLENDVELGLAMPDDLFRVERIARISEAGRDDQYWLGGRILPKGRQATASEEESEHWAVVLNFSRNLEEAATARLSLIDAYPDIALEIYEADEGYGTYFVVVYGIDLSQLEAKKRIREMKCAGMNDKTLMFMTNGKWKKIAGGDS